MSYMTISSQEKHNFSLCSCFHAHPTTLLLKILGGPMHGRSPHLKFWGGTVPPVPLGLRPCILLFSETFHDTKILTTPCTESGLWAKIYIKQLNSFRKQTKVKICC